MQDKTYKLVCALCGGTNIEQRAWVDPNSDIIIGSCSDGDIDDNWCDYCEKHVEFKTIEV